MSGHQPSSETDDGLTLCVLGCGTLGTAILAGILSSLSDSTSSDTPTTKGGLPSRLPTKFIACVRSAPSAERIHNTLARYNPTSLTVLVDDNIRGVSSSDVIILGCKPYMVADLLGSSTTNPEMHAALTDKLLISICAGLSVPQINSILCAPDPCSVSSSNPPRSPCHIIRAMPNTASLIRQSMTVLHTPSPPLPTHLTTLTRWIFAQIGLVTELPSSASMDPPTALCGSGPAFCALMIEALADGGVAMGLPRQEAILMAAQTMKGAAGLVLAGEHPAVVKEKVATPGGCTMGGLMVLEERAVRGAISLAVREATTVAAEMGGGKPSANGTRRG